MTVHGGEPAGGLLIAGAQAMTPQELVIARRLTGTFAHALALLETQRSPDRLPSFLKGKRRTALICAGLALLGAMAFPVSLSVLAPVEIKARDPFLVNAPLDAVVRNVLVEPNQAVQKGQPLISFDDTVLRNGAEVAQREKLVAEAKYKKARQLAFDNQRGHGEIGIAQAEYALKATELEYAQELLAQATVKAQRSGVVVYSDRQELLGKPVVTGQRLLHIADPANLEAAIDLDISDAIALEPGSRVEIFLDSDPLKSLDAEVRFAAYEARERPGGILAYQVIASLEAGSRPRLGARGTAELHGGTVPLVLYLFRRPLSAARQWIGL